MIVIDWLALLLGFLLGVAVSSMFFIGLAWGMRLALASSSPYTKLLLSFVLRLGFLLGIGFVLAAATANLWPVLGYGLAYFVVRFFALRRARLEVTDATNAR